VHESGVVGHNYVFAAAFLDVVTSEGKTLIFASPEGTVHGTLDIGSRASDFQIDGPNDPTLSKFIADNWETVKRSRVEWRLHVSTNPIAVVEAVLVGLFVAVGVGAGALFVSDPNTHCEWFPPADPEHPGLRIITCTNEFE
jgi:hypothetical protein